MSRKGLYNQKARTHTVYYGPSYGTTVQHWKFGTLDSRFALEDATISANTTSFVTRTWLKTDEHVSPDDGEQEIVTFESTGLAPLPKPEPESDALTASDIRGAVGGESIPGIASGYSESPTVSGATSVEPSADVSLGASAEESVQYSADVSVEPSVEPSAEPSDGGQKFDGDGDAIME